MLICPDTLLTYLLMNNSSVLSWLRKLAADGDVSRRSGGRLFQVTGPETFDKQSNDRRIKVES